MADDEKASEKASSEDPIDRLVNDLKAKLAARKNRIHELIRSWDTDDNGEVSLAEFRKAIKQMKLCFTEDVIEAAFNSMDEDRSGNLDIDELHKILSLTPPRRATLIMLRESKAKQAKFARLHAESVKAAQEKAKEDATPTETLILDLLAKLSARRGRIIDFFRSSDANHDGLVSCNEFAEAITTKLKLSFSDDIVKAAFESLDKDKSGEIDIEELSKALSSIRPRRNTKLRLQLSRARVDAIKVDKTNAVGFEGCFSPKSFNKGQKGVRAPFNSLARRDKYTSWVQQYQGGMGTPVKVGPGCYPADS